MKQSCLTVILLIWGMLPLSARIRYDREWNVSFSAGSSLPGSNRGAGVGYTAFFSRFVGFSVGLEADLYGYSLNLRNFSTYYQVQTPPGLSGNFYLQTDGSGIKEKQRLVFAQLPVMLQLQAPLGEKTFFYARAGAKAGLPILAKWSQTVETLTAKGYSDYTNQWYENMPGHGFETQNNVKTSGRLALENPVTLALECGLKWKISGKNAVYTGIYVDYQLNGIIRDALISPFFAGVRIRMAIKI